MHDRKRAFAARLRQAMEAKGWEPIASVLERAFNLHHPGPPVGLHGVARWLKGETLPRVDKMQTLSEVLGVPVQWLWGSAIVVPRASEPPGPWSSPVGLDERQLLRAVTQLPLDQRRTIRDVILAFLQADHARRQARAQVGVPQPMTLPLPSPSTPNPNPNPNLRSPDSAGTKVVKNPKTPKTPKTPKAT